MPDNWQSVDLKHLRALRAVAARGTFWAAAEELHESLSTLVELLAPLGPETPVGKYLERRGPGLHHVAYAVQDIDAELERLRGAGLRLIDERPRMGIRNSRVAFVHPRSTGGVLTEIVQPAEDH